MADPLPTARPCTCPDCQHRPVPAWIDQALAHEPFFAVDALPDVLKPLWMMLLGED